MPRALITGINGQGRDKVKIDPSLVRENEVHILKGNPEKIKSIGWSPKVDFKGLVRMMCE